MLHLQQEAQREGDGAAQAAVRNDELVFGGQLDDAELVDKEGQADNTWGKKRRAELLPDSLHELLEYDETGFSPDFEKKHLVEAIGTVSVNMPSCKFANPELVTGRQQTQTRSNSGTRDGRQSTSSCRKGRRRSSSFAARAL